MILWRIFAWCCKCPHAVSQFCCSSNISVFSRIRSHQCGRCEPTSMVVGGLLYRANLVTVAENESDQSWSLVQKTVVEISHGHSWWPLHWAKRPWRSQSGYQVTMDYQATRRTGDVVNACIANCQVSELKLLWHVINISDWIKWQDEQYYWAVWVCESFIQSSFTNCQNDISCDKQTIMTL